MNRQELGAWLGLNAEQTGRMLPSLVRGMADVPVPTTDEEQVAAFKRWCEVAGKAPAIPAAVAGLVFEDERGPHVYVDSDGHPVDMLVDLADDDDDDEQEALERDLQDEYDAHGEECCCERCLQDYPERDALYNDNQYYGVPEPEPEPPDLIVGVSDDELTEADRQALAEYRQAEGLHTGWARAIPNPADPDGPPITYIAHAAGDAETIRLLDALATAALKHMIEAGRVDTAAAAENQSPNRAVAESQEQMLQRLRDRTLQKRRQRLGERQRRRKGEERNGNGQAD